MHYTLGQTGGAGRIHDVEQLIVAGAHGRFIVGGGITHRYIVSHYVLAKIFSVLPGCSRRRNPDPVTHIGLVATTMELTHRVDEFFAEDKCSRTAVLENKFKLVRHQAPIERNNDAADLGDREIGFDKLGTIH